jgi:branched-chain amino acid transport system substrate-binding protein
LKQLAWLVLAALLGSGCSVALNFDECKQDSDCAGRADGGVAFCTSDHLCVGNVPEERLCTSGSFGAASPSAVMVAGLFRLSGASGDKDTEMAQAAELAMQDLAKVSQRPIAMVLCDTAGGQAARSLDKAFRDYHVVGAVGPTTSGDVLSSVGGEPSAAAVAIADGILVITPSATSPQVSGLDDHNLIWRTAGSDNLQAGVLAQLVPAMIASGTTMRPTVIDTAYVSSAYGSGLDTAFVAALAQAASLTPIATHQFDTGVDPNSVIGELGADAPDYSLIVADDDAAALAGSLYQNPPALALTQFLFTDGAKGPDLIGAMPNLQVAHRIRGTAPATPSGPVFDTFKLEYQNQFGSDPATTAFVANTYDAAWALALAIAGQPPGAAIVGDGMANAMMRMSTPGVTVTVGGDFNTGATTLAMGGAIDLAGTSGPLTWDNASGDVTDAPIEVWAIDTNQSPPTFCTISPPPKTCP